MDFELFASLLSAVYPPLKDTITYVTARRGSFTGDLKYQEQLKKMISMTQEDLSRLKTELEELRKVCAELNLPTGERGAVPWHIPHDLSAYLTWRYRRVGRKIQHISSEFSTSLDGIIDVIACCAGIMAAGDKPTMPATEPDWARDLGRHHEDLRDKMRTPSQYSIDELTNAMEQFIDVCRTSIQKLSNIV